MWTIYAIMGKNELLHILTFNNFVSGAEMD